MTNATVAKRRRQRWSYADRQIQGRREESRVVADNTPIVTFVAGDKSELKPGAKVIAFGEQRPDGSLETNRVGVGRDGLTPPM